jgi:hypothetical protein
VSDPISDFSLDSPAKLDNPFADLDWFREHHPVYPHEPIGQRLVFPMRPLTTILGID